MMEVNCENLKRSLHKLGEVIGVRDERLSKLVKLKEYSQDDVIKILNFLEEKLLDVKYTEYIGAYFKSCILVLVSSACNKDVIDTDFEKYQRKCIALSTLVNNSPDVLRFAKKYFHNKPPPFLNPSKHAPKKKARNNEVTVVNDLEIVKCCYNLLNADTAYFKDLWDWSVFTSNYFGQGCDLQKIYSNHVMAFLSNMNSSQIQCLNENIPEKIHVQFDQEINKTVRQIEDIRMKEEDTKLSSIQLTEIHSDETNTYIEGVMLPVYNKENAKFYSHSDGNYDKFVKVDSTKMNLRSIVLGISSGKAICLSGPVGCGKTTLVEYVARKTGRICPKQLEIEKSSRSKTVLKEKVIKLDNSKGISKKRTSDENLDEFQSEFWHKEMFKDVENKNGFLRIQLGDQTDSKMLLGQYRCTDVPGEFIWSPGVLTEAVLRGCWLLLEDIDCATQDIYTVLSNLLENNFLNVPGFRDCIKIEPGFQLFATVRTQKSRNSAQKVIFSLLEKYLYKVNVLPLSRKELCQIVSRNYPKLSTIANRVVDVYLTFSSGDHLMNDTIRHDETDDSVEDSANYTSLPFQKVSISSLPNSGRTVSTRDLVKLCQRSNPMFSVTSTECAYFVFQNAVDVFCSYLPQSEAKTKLITSIGAKLGIIQSRCEFFSDEYRPEVEVCDNLIKVGRAQLAGKATEYVNGNDIDDVPYKKMKLAGNEVKSSSTAIKMQKSNTFSFTRITSCLLEKVAVCVDQNEPVLLVGETGVGKTTSIQYLAEKTQHKLVVVNMNNQSDVSDLVGGYKPVDLKYVMAPLRTDFEILFRKTFNETKNEKFLSNISICFNQNNFVVLIRAMLNIVEIVFQKSRNGDLKGNRCQEYLPKWKELQVKLSKLNSQLKKSINISFAFIPGSLVNCIKNGDWVLLDEINLASAETLECLSTILEPDGSIVLLEKGDFTPVKRHPSFRIFACMNPSTDIGKKDLPVGIRNRFTELFVDELTTENDLVVLVSDYLNNTGIKKVKVFDIVKLYKKLKALSRLELNDGLGNRPVYSLRTLCRALTVCAKNLCGSIERNLYESFCLSFLTQLDPISHKVVLALITEVMLSNSKAVLSQSIPQPGVDYINFEGYWIKKGPKEILDCLNYILTGSVKENLKDLARIVSIGKLPILLQGPTSAGKTSLIEYVAKKSGNHCLRINNHEHTDLQEYIGAYTSDVSGKLSFKEGVLAQAMRNGYWIILDELNLASTDILEALNRVLDDNRELFIPETQTVIKAHPNFMLFATQNPPGLYGGRKTLSRAFKNRFIELHFSEIPKPELEIILEKRCFIPKSYSQKMVKCMSELQVNRKTTTRSNFTLRDLFRWGNRYTNADKSLLADNLYDWNQHLVDEGYLVLSAKVRTEVEISIIEETLFNHFRKKVSIDKLYTFSENSSMVTRHILENIHNYKKRTDIIWTQNLIRMAVLTAKALEFNEPVLLVGPTGCGKTTICQILAEISKTNLQILNCHMHTEGADFLGGLRPYRNSENDSNSSRTKLFEWSDGPLVLSMINGSFFMADEISLAEDSVLERLNSILEPERTLLLAEKGGINNDADTGVLSKVEEEFIIHARKGFQFLATMNPGGDFGKKELSPALRNRFTEIWCRPSDAREDLIRIATNALNVKLPSKNDDELLYVANVLIDVVFYLKDNIEKFKFSVRDILSWAHYISENVANLNLSLPEAITFGLEIVFLDSLEMLPHESMDNVEKTKKSIFEFTISKIRSTLNVEFDQRNLEIKRSGSVHRDSEKFGISPFFIKCKSNMENCTKDFLFETPTTKKNLFRLLSALSLKKAILLEGPPGVGKTSIVENLVRAIGYRIVRINLCEHTDLADLFGSDLPVEEKSLEMKPTENGGTESSKLGSFAWRDGPLLAALKLKNTWILLDELNLAPQSVLEGLNAILDHRGEVFIPELNRTFVLGNETRIFACQNPLRQGGGRKGLPQSFLNRFTKVYLKKLTTEDLLFVVNQRYSFFFSEINKYFQNIFENFEPKTNATNLFDVMNSAEELSMTSEKHDRTIDVGLSKRMVVFSEILDKGISDFEFGIKGGPFEINLRDLLRWCDLMVNPKTGFVMNNADVTTENDVRKIFGNFLLILYERMKLVYYQRMRSSSDKQFVRNAFSRAFNCDAEKLNSLSEDIGLYWTDTEIHLNDIMIERDPVRKIFADSSEDNIHYQFLPFLKNYSSPLLLSSQRELLKNIAECAHMEKVVILCGPTDSGKTKIVNALCTVSNQICNFDTIDDSVTGSFQQIDLNRNLEEVSRNVECIFTLLTQRLTLDISRNQKFEDVRSLTELQSLWKQYNDLTREKIDNQSTPGISEELLLFKRRMEHINMIIDKIVPVEAFKPFWVILKDFQIILQGLKHVVQNAESLNTGGHFEWVDSKIVQSLKYGQYICLEHANLCSAAILDRLNSVFEPDGNLLISEKGVMSSTDAEVVEKHKNFRAFLTVDAKNGELSRAMRNRCIEIALNSDCYGRDDLRMMIYESGVKEMNLVNTLLNVHQKIKELSELSSYSTSHLLHFSFLFECYKRIGYDNKRALYDSGMQVYVYPSNADLLGYGLLYYQEKMRDIIKEESENIEMQEIYCNFGNLIPRSNRLNSMSFIRLICEPLIVVLKCYPDINACNEQLKQMLSDFQDIKSEDYFGLLKNIICLLYNTISFADVVKMNEYICHAIRENLNTDGKFMQSISDLNDSLFGIIKNSQPKFMEYVQNLPWNTKLFSRIRLYENYVNVDKRNELRLSILLACNILVEAVEKQDIVKISKMSALAYSQAVSSKNITDTINNSLLNELHKFLQNFRPYLNSVLTEVDIDINNFARMLTSFLWINRLHKCSKRPIYKDKILNNDLVDNLLLHFKWIRKHILQFIEQLLRNHEFCNNDFNIALQKIERYSSKADRPLNSIKKTYFKLVTNFSPLYSEEQIQLYILRKKYEQLVALIPKYGTISNNRLVNKINMIFADESQRIKSLLLAHNPDFLKYMKTVKDSDVNVLESAPGLIECLQDFMHVPESSVEHKIDLDEINNSLTKLHEVYDKEDDDDYFKEKTHHSVYVGTLMLREYFVAKSFGCSTLNENYLEETPSLSIDVLEAIRGLGSIEFSKFRKCYLVVLNHIKKLQHSSEVKELLKSIPISIYKNLSTFNRILTSAVQSYQLSALSNRRDVYNAYRDDVETSAEVSYSGPPLTDAIFSLIFQCNGELRPIALSELDLWKKSLDQFKQLLWSNSFVTADVHQNCVDDLNTTILESKKLSMEVEYIQELCQDSQNMNYLDYNKNFKILAEKLLSIQGSAAEVLENLDMNLHISARMQQLKFYSSLLHSLRGSLEICLLTFMPLIDPVEKNRLKTEYVNQDISCLNTIMQSYDIMKSVLAYRNFGSEIYHSLETQIAQFEERKGKLCKKLALRPEVCLYSSLVQEVNHFLVTNCEPKSLLSLVQAVEECWQQLDQVSVTNEELLKIDEVIKRMYLWISNSQKFLHHSLAKYYPYYNDFIKPIECAIIMIKYGLTGLKDVLTQRRTTISILNLTDFQRTINKIGVISETLENITRYPSTSELDIFNRNVTVNGKKGPSTLLSIVNSIEDSNYLRFQLLKVKLSEIKSHISISSEIDELTFSKLDIVLRIVNQIWEEEEELKRKKKAEDESLYINKTRCQTETDEEAELREIEENFPTFVNEDFGQYIQQDTLEKVIVPKSNQNSSQISNIINENECKLLGKSFVYIMEHFSRLSYYNPPEGKALLQDLDFLTPFKNRIEVFAKLFSKYKFCLNEWADEAFYNSCEFAISLQQNNLKDYAISSKNDTENYNFYKDSNIPEIVSCTEVLDQIASRVGEQLALYPDHAVLIDIILIIKKIRSLPVTSPITRFNTGFQILRQKLSQWNEVAHKNNHLRDLEITIAENVQNWTKLELQYWRNCLLQTYDKVESSAYKYWFFIYNLIHEYLQESECNTVYSNFNSVEKKFEEGELTETTGNSTKISTLDVINILSQFIEASNYADYFVRMKLLKAFELYLHALEIDNTTRKESLIAVFHNLYTYFDQFRGELEETIRTIRTPIEKKLKELVKIESYNKDLSYFSMKNNVARVHRHLNKFLKEYENLLKAKISKVFQQKENHENEYSLDNDKGINLRHEPKIKYYMIDVKNFIAPQKLKNLFMHESIETTAPLLRKIDKHFSTSRNVAKQIIACAEFPSLIYSVDMLLAEQIERCDYLRKLEVDRSQEKAKQKSEAKSILQQKRKGLSDLYKTLANLGVNYRTGLMELSLNTELTDYEIEPFCVKSMLKTLSHKKLDQNLIYLNENLDNYYAKCIFKLKLVKNVMLTPNNELGPPNVDRMKGFSVDLFLLVQKQRKMLSKLLTEIYDFRSILSNMTNIFDVSKNCNFSNEQLDFEKAGSILKRLKISFRNIVYVLEQFSLLLKSAPEKVDNKNIVSTTDEFVITKENSKYQKTLEEVHKTLDLSKETSKEIFKLTKCEFISLQQVQKINDVLAAVTARIIEVKDTFKLSNNSFLPVAKPLLKLLEDLQKSRKEQDQIISEYDATLDAANIDMEIENIIHSVLLALQNLFKKYSKENGDKPTENTSPSRKSTETEQIIHDNHLRDKIHKELSSDLEVLNMSTVIKKLSNIMLVIKYSKLPEKGDYIKKLVSIVPVLEQFNLVADYYLFQQLGAHKVVTKMLYVMLTVFIELGSKGFCIPPDLMQDEDGEQQKEEKKGEGFGFEDGIGENDVSDKIESEDQLDDAKRPEDNKENENDNKQDCKEEKGIEMSEDFDGKMQDIEKPEDDEDNEEEDADEDIDKEMGETDQAAEKLDDQIWGSDEENEESENEENMSEEENGKGSKDEDDKHNNLASQNETTEQGNEEQQEGLDATDENNSNKDKKKQQNDIDDMKDSELDEEQINPYHNELEEPPEAQDMDLGDNCDLDEGNNQDEDNQNIDDPFDIDKMKENMEDVDDEGNDEKEGGEENETQNDELNESDSEPEPEAGTKRDEEEVQQDMEENENKEEEEDNLTKKPDEVEKDEEKDLGSEDIEKEEENKTPEDFQKSKDKASKEENVQAMPDDDHKGSDDKVQNDTDKEVKQNEEMDSQDTGEDKEGVGVAENEVSDRGHQGVAETKEKQASEQQQKKADANEKRKQARTNEERTLGEAEKDKIKRLKTIDKLNEKLNDAAKDEDNEEMDVDAEEYQHIKEPKKNDRITLDGATEDQSKNVQHAEEQEEVVDEEQNNDELMDVDVEQDLENVDNVPEVQPEQMDSKSDKPSRNEKTKEKCETTEEVQVEGDITETITVPRQDDTTAHCVKEILMDTTTAQDLSAIESLELRKMYQDQIMGSKAILPHHDDYEEWQLISNKMLPSARELCEQLRLILEPTKCTRLKGDYRTGRRINMKKIIPYIASQFRKDKIWLRRTKPAQRDYKITIAIDDSKSMHHNNSKALTLQAISLISQALTLLESGKLSILSFGEAPQIILNHTEQFEGPKLVKSLNFDQNQSKIAELLNFIRTANAEGGSSGSDNDLFENLLIILSDGRNIYSEGEQKVKHAVKLARMQRIFLVYIIIDNPENKHSILDIRVPQFSSDKKSLTMRSYLDVFPFPYYVIVRDLNQLPIVLSEAMRQWFELVHSEL